eukprot:gene10446-11365_t
MENTQMIRLKNSEKLLNLQFLNLLKTDEGNNMINGDNNEDGKPLPLSLLLANWFCSNGHTFQSTLQSLTRVARRNGGVSCPVCLAAKEKAEERREKAVAVDNENSDNAMVTLQSSGGSFPPLFPRRLKSLNKKDSPTLPSLPSTMQVNNKKQLRKLTQLQNRELLLSVLQEKGGRLSFPEEDLPLDLQVKSSLSIICEKNHTFISKIRNLIYHDNWCPTCRNRGSYSRNPQEELQKVANWFNGTFLGFIGNINTTTTLLPLRRRSIKDNEKSYRQSTIFQDGLWRCSEGHEFITNVHNIRNNPPLQKRNYSLCSTCRYQLRRTFKWNPIEKRWDRGEATVPRISKKLLAFKEKLDSYVIEKRGKIYSNATTEELLSDGWESKIPLICHNHHVWKASVKTILASQTWCKRCAMENTQMIRLKNSEKLLNVQLLHFTETNKDNNGDSKPLSPSLSLANWSCSNGHTFQSTLQSLTRVAKLNHGISCPVCLEAKEKEGRKEGVDNRNNDDDDEDGDEDDDNKFSLDNILLQRVYFPKTKLPLLLSRVTMKSMKENKKIDRLESYRQRLLEHVSKNNGRLLSPEKDLLFYQGSNTPIHLICDKNHTWEVKLSNLLSQKTWCRRCANTKVNMDTFHKVASWFNGTFIELQNNTNIVYPSLSYAPAVWRCSEGHEFVKHLYSFTLYPKPERRKFPVCDVCAEDRLKRVKWNSEFVRWENV